MPNDPSPALPSPRKPTQPRAKPAGIDGWALLRAMRRHWLLATVLGVLAAGGAGAAVWFFLPPGKHTVTRVLHVSAMPWTPFEQQRGADFHTYKQTQVALLRSPKVCNAALRSPKVANSEWLQQTPEPREWLEKNLQVTFPASAELMHVSLMGSVEEIPILTALVDAVVEVYLSEIVEKDRQLLLQREKQLRDIAATYEEKVKKIRLSMNRLRKEAGSGDPKNLNLKQNLALSELVQATQELTRLRSEMRSLRTQLEQEGKVNPREEAAGLEEDVQKAFATDSELTQLKKETATLREQIDRDAERSPLGRKAAALQESISKLKEREDEIKRLEGKIRKTVASRLQQERNRNAGLGVGGMRQRLAYLEDLEKLLIKDCDRLTRESKELNLRAVDLEDFNLDLTEFDQMRAALVKKADMLSVEAQSPARVSRVDQEALVVAPDELARKIRFGSLAGAGAACLVLLCICLWELRIQRVTSPAEVAQTVGLMVIGVLPFYRANKGGVKAAERLKEAVDDARTLLLHHADGHGQKALLVTSATSGEGKTSLACHLAASLARAGRRTLLIDADLRKPDAHNVFGRQNTPGLCEVLRGESPLSQVTQEVGLPGLRLIPAGKCDDRALRAVAQASFATLLAQLRQEHDFIIIDSSPVLDVPDALMLGKAADGVLFAVMQSQSRSNCLASAAERFARLDAPILGLIVNGAFDVHKGTYGKETYGAEPVKNSAT